MLVLMISISPIMLRSSFKPPVNIVRSTSLVPADGREEQSVGIAPLLITSPWPLALRLLCVLNVSDI